MRRSLIVLVAALIVLSANINADTWLLPTTEKYYSANRRYRLDVVPRKLESQLRYFEDSLRGEAPAGAVPGEERTRPRAIFQTHRKWWWGYSKKFEFPLTNDVAPVDALVSDDGEYFVTFDNWHMMGYGNDVIVIYRSLGEIVAKFGLNDLLTEGDLQTIPRSVSSIHWSGKHTIDEKKGHLVLQIVSNGITGDRTPEFEELRIDLRTGKPLQARQDRFPGLTSTVTVGPPTVSEPLGTESKMICRPTDTQMNPAGLPIVSTDDLLSRARQKTVPEYPILARLARVQGTVALDVIVNGTGAVSCVRLEAGHPLLNSSAFEAAFQWRFSEFTGGSVLGNISFSFEQRIEKPPAVAQDPR